MLFIVRTHRLFCACVLFVALLLGSGYMGVLALCRDFDGPPHVEEISFGCCHCTEHGTPTDPAHPLLDAQHEHCTDIVISLSFIGHSSTLDALYDYLSLDHPNPVMNWLEGTSDVRRLLGLDDEGPPASPPRQVFAVLSTTVIIC